MNSRGFQRIVLTTVLAVVPSAFAGAEGTTCGFETIVIPDGRIQTGTIPNGATFWFLWEGPGTNRSYSVHVQFTNSALSGPSAVLVTGPSGCTLTADGVDTSANEPETPFGAGFRRSLFTTSTQHRVRFSNASGAAQPYSLSVSDTTAFSSQWSTNGQFDTFWSFYNTTSATINGRLQLFNGATGAQVSLVNFAILANRTNATGTQALATPRNLTGTAIFTHDGPPGAIQIEADIANFFLNPPYIQPVKFDTAREIR